MRLDNIKSTVQKYIAVAIVLLTGLSLESCDDYLSIKPKKQEIPTTLEDFTAFFNNEGMTTGPHMYMTMNASMLMGEYYYPYIDWYSPTDLQYIIYKWTDGDRFEHSNGNSDFRFCYRGIAVANQIIEGATKASGCTEADRQSAIASARILRVLHYFHVSQIYAEAYDPLTADTKLSVPVILSSGMDAHFTQPTLKDFYDFMVSELTLAIECESLPNFGDNILIPGKGAAYAAMARVQLQMRNYEEALSYAEKALSINNKLIDWVQIYHDNYDEYFKEWNSSKMMTPPLEHDCIENYYFGHGHSSTSRMYSVQLPLEAGELFEEGDCFFKCNWVLEPWNGGSFYYNASRGFFNLGGLRSVEQYFIKAECLARLNKVAESCDVINTIRKKLIDTDCYSDFTAATADEAIIKIRDLKHTTLIHSTMALADAKRFNAEGKYPFIPKKKIKGEIRYLQPDDRLWTCPFAQDVMAPTVYGTVTQNVPN